MFEEQVNSDSESANIGESATLITAWDWNTLGYTCCGSEEGSGVMSYKKGFVLSNVTGRFCLFTLNNQYLNRVFCKDIKYQYLRIL